MTDGKIALQELLEKGKPIHHMAMAKARRATCASSRPNRCRPQFGR